MKTKQKEKRNKTAKTKKSWYCTIIRKRKKRGKGNQHYYPLKGTKKEALISALGVCVANLSIKRYSILMKSLQLL